MRAAALLLVAALVGCAGRPVETIHCAAWRPVMDAGYVVGEACKEWTITGKRKPRA